MTSRTTKQLKTRKFFFGDGSETIERFAVLENGKRIGTVHKVTTDDRVVWYDPFRGSKGDGKIVTNGYIIARKRTLEEAIEVI